MELRKAIDTLITVEEHKSVLYNFVTDRFKEKKSEFYSTNKSPSLFFIFKSYKILDKNNIQIEYEYGSGDYSYFESFVVDVRPYIRDEKIENLKSK